MIFDFVGLIPTVLLGTGAGLITGIVPGFGPAQFLILVYGLLMQIDPLHLMVFYIALLITSQVIDVVPAMYFGIPGETASIATAYEGPHCVSQNQDLVCLRYILTGRFIAVIVAILMTLLLMQLLDSVSQLFATKWQFLMLMLAFVGVLIASSGKKSLTMISMLVGMVLGLVGYSYTMNGNFLTFGWQPLENGIPVITFGFGALIVPFLFNKFIKNNIQLENTLINQVVEKSKIYWTVFRSSVIGWFLGLVPGLSYIISATGSYNLEKKLQIAKMQYGPGNVNCIVANETGNTAGSISTLFPLLIFGIPITVSEVLIFDLMINNGAVFSSADFFNLHVTQLLLTVVVTIVLSSLAVVILSKNLQIIKKLINARWLFLTTVVIALIMIIYYCYITNILLVGLVGLFLGVVVGWILRYSDIMPALFAFVLAGTADRTIFNVIQLYF